ncbi:MAG: hypothetical protein FRX49_12878 [Trebouxia sp. A1-2]|nr:MAG: hypothetical protein FRX49_12878 [Trebouxia sp. A1-2]
MRITVENCSPEANWWSQHCGAQQCDEGRGLVAAGATALAREGGSNNFHDMQHGCVLHEGAQLRQQQQQAGRGTCVCVPTWWVKGVGIPVGGRPQHLRTGSKGQP